MLDQMSDSVLLRAYDVFSGSNPNAQRVMLAREPRLRLDTVEARDMSLTAHVNYRNRKPTPYISFTNSPYRL